VDNPFAVPLELRPEVVGVFGVPSAQAFPAFGGVGSEMGALLSLKILPSADRHEIVMDGGMGESREGKISEEQGVKRWRMSANKLPLDEGFS
jgi:hypothetical protein